MFHSPEKQPVSPVSINRIITAPLRGMAFVRPVIMNRGMLPALAVLLVLLVPALAPAKDKKPYHTYPALLGIEIQI